MSIRPIRPLILLLLSCLSCAGTDVGNPTVSLDAALVGAGSSTSSATVTGAWINVERLRLRPASDCDGGAEIDLEGPFALDLLSPGMPPALSDLPVSSTSYCRFELRWVPLEAGSTETPAELEGASLLLAGTLEDGTPFVVRSERNDELRLDALNGAFQIDSDATGLFVGIDVTELFAGIPLGEAVPDADGAIRIEPGSNDDLLASFEDALEAATRLFRDHDSNGDLDDDESDPADALAD